MYEHAFGQVSGYALDAFHAVASRWRKGEQLDFRTGESHVYEVDSTGGYTEVPRPGVYASLWRSESGQVFVAHKDGALFTRDTNGSWSQFSVRASLLGVWGLDDEHVWAWGLRGKSPVMYQSSDRETWVEIASPPEMVFNLAGDRPDRLLAVGMKGMIALWDGSRWRSQASPVTGALSSIHWVSEDEIYACGTGTAFVLEGSVHGWSRRGPFELPLHCVAKHSGKLWVGCGAGGLQSLPGDRDELELVKAKIQPWHFDPRGELLISCRDMIAATKDGASFKAVPIVGYETITANQAPTF